MGKDTTMGNLLEGQDSTTVLIFLGVAAGGYWWYQKQKKEKEEEAERKREKKRRKKEKERARREREERERERSPGMYDAGGVASCVGSRRKRGHRRH